MTGEQLFTRLQEKGIIPTEYKSTGWAITWENSAELVKLSYSFFVSCKGPFTGEELYKQVRQRGVISDQYSWSEQPSFMQDYYNAIAALLSEEEHN